MLANSSKLEQCLVLGNFGQGEWESNLSHLSPDNFAISNNRLAPSVASVFGQNTNCFWRFLLKQTLGVSYPGILVRSLNSRMGGRGEIFQLISKCHDDMSGLKNGDEPLAEHPVILPKTSIELLAGRHVFLVDVTESMSKHSHFEDFTNVAEAEFTVGLFMLLRLQGVRPEHISILSPYSAQKRLIREILTKKCGWHETFGMPSSVKTVQEFKSDTNSIVILSLTHTQSAFGLGSLKIYICIREDARIKH